MSRFTELLTQIEDFSGVLIACTKFLESLDPASLRRFQFKVGFKSLAWEGLLPLLGRLYPALASDEAFAASAAGMAGLLTAADVASMAERIDYSGMGGDGATLLAELGRECAMKRPRSSIGFSA